MDVLGLRDAVRRDESGRTGRGNPRAAALSPAETLPRRFGEFLLTTRLNEDCLGQVYRALSLADKGEFVRLRILDSHELSRGAIAEAAGKRREAEPGQPSRHRVRDERMGVIGGIPYLAWNEVHGWTLDSLLAECRRVGARLPLEHVLLIANGITIALDAPTPHGLVWPGFVSIGDDGEVRLGGFGLAEAVLPSLSEKALFVSLSPYLAPEVYEEGLVSRNADVYSVALIILELLTDWRTPFPGLGKGVGAGDGFPHALGRLLQVSLAKSRSRLESVGDLRRELGKLVVSGHYRLSSFDFSRYLANITKAEKVRRGRAGAKAGEALPEPIDETEIDTALQRFWGQIKI